MQTVVSCGLFFLNIINTEGYKMIKKNFVVLKGQNDILLSIIMMNLDEIWFVFFLSKKSIRELIDNLSGNFTTSY